MIEDLPVAEPIPAEAAKFINLDMLLSPRDLASPNGGPDEQGGLEMDTDDLRLLGFQLVEEADVVDQQRTSNVSVTYT